MINDLRQIQTAKIYRAHLDERPEGYEKPVVHFKGEAEFHVHDSGSTVARVFAVDHPYWGAEVLRTSTVLKRFDDGSFETRNTIYKPYKEDRDAGQDE